MFYNGQNAKEQQIWRVKDVNWDNFQADLSEIDCIYDGNINTLNKNIIRDINVVARKNVKLKGLNQ